jgi:methylated-DNA-[protein]-cysteine S-methyltransferase
MGEMAIAWEGEEVIGIFLPEANRLKLLRQARKRLEQPKLTWASELPPFVGHMAAKIRAHLRGEPQRFSLDQLSLAKRSPFFRRVYECTNRIPAGKVRTYAELASAAGSPKAFRAVGQAMARNPFPIVVPCHRVIGSGKSPGGFTAHGGLNTKARLLEMEHASLGNEHQTH